jgi:hypothetical protein
MKLLAVLKEAFKADGWGATAGLSTLLAGCLGLIAANWVSAGLFLSVSAGASVRPWERIGPKTEQSAKWARGVILAAGVGFLGVAFANAVRGDAVLAVISAFAGALSLYDVFFGRRRRAGRPKISRSV